MAAPAAAQPRPAATTALYVGDLHPAVTEQILWAAFADAGLIRHVRVCQDSNTKRSLGYGYVNFVSAADAERALDTKAGIKILDRPCRVMWSQRNPDLRRSGVGNLFVKNLAPTVDQKKLQSEFSVHGNILSCKVMTDEKGGSKGFGFVHFESPEAAQDAIAKKNGQPLDGQPIFVAQHVPKKSRPSVADTKWTNVFVKNLPGDYTEEKLRELFSKFGAVTSVCCHKRTFSAKGGAPDAAAAATTRCFGFANFGTHDEAVKAIQELHEQKMEDTQLYVARALTKIERAATIDRTAKREPVQSNLYVKNLEEGVTKEILESHFSKFGQITSAVVALDQNGQSRGFGFVNFTSVDAAQKAIADASGHAITGFTKPLVVCLFEPKQVRAPRLSAQKAAMMQQQQMLFASPQMGYGWNPAFQAGRPPMQNARHTRSGAPHGAGAAGGRRPPTGQHMPPHAAGAAQGHLGPVATAPIPARPLVLPTKQQLLGMAPTEAQTTIGDFLFNTIKSERNGKITGMLLSMHASDLPALIELVHNPEELAKNIEEANAILSEQAQ